MIQSARLGDLVEITNGYAFKSSDYVDSGIRVIRITNVQKGSIVDNNPQYYPLSSQSTLKRYLINEGDILMSLTGNVGRVGRFPAELLPAYINQRVCRVKSCSSKLSDDYLFYVLNSDLFERDAIENSAGVAQLNLSTKWIEDYKIVLPPLAEQQKIAAILDAADSIRQKDQQLVERYTALSQSLFLEMFGDSVTNPMGWEQISLKDACEKIYGGGTPSKSNPEFYEGDIPWVTPKDMKLEYISNSIDHINQLAIKNSTVKLIPKNSVLMVIRSGVLKHTLPVAISTCEVTINQDMKAYIPKNEITNSYYLLHFFKAVEKYLLGKVRAVTADNIEFKQIQELDFLLPPLNLQRQFAEHIQLIEAQKLQAIKSLEKSEALFNSLLHRAFTGELTAKMVA